MNGRTLSGCGTALVTPFKRDGKVDEDALRRFVEWQVAEGIHFVVPCGSTGEAATMTPAEHRRVFADGAISAAEWLQGKKGVFTMSDVLQHGGDTNR